ncbi:MAG: hypothetical protein ACOCX4_10610, partial [Planctomycetota bacterium]
MTTAPAMPAGAETSVHCAVARSGSSPPRYGSRRCTSSRKTLYRTGFEEGQPAPEGWQAEGSALVSPLAHTGERSLLIRTWVTDEKLADLRAEYDLEALMEANFPVSFNLFLLDDPLLCDLAVQAPDERPAIRSGMTLWYDIRDYNYRRFGEYSVTLTADQIRDYTGIYRTVNRAGEDIFPNGRLILLTLPDELREHEGKTLFLHAKLLDGEKLMAEDEVTFGIVPLLDRRPETLWTGCKVAANWQPGPDVRADFDRADGEGYNEHAYKLGAQWNGAPISREQWRAMMGITHYGWPVDYLEAPETTPEFGPVERTFPAYGRFHEYYLLQAFKRGAKADRVFPRWMLERGQEKYGDKYEDYTAMFDLDAQAAFLARQVAHKAKIFPNAYIINPTAGETVSWVDVDQKTIGLEYTRHALDLGHRQVAVIYHQPDNPGDRIWLEGVHTAFADAGRRCDPTLMYAL